MKKNPWPCVLSQGMQNQHVEINWSVVTTAGGRHLAGGPSSTRRTSRAICHPGKNALVTRSFASRSSSPRRSVSPASLRAVPSIFPWTTSFNPPSPSTPIPIFRRMRRPGRASSMRRSISPVSDPAPGALLLREHYLLLCGAISWARNRGPGRSAERGLGLGLT